MPDPLALCIAPPACRKARLRNDSAASPSPSARPLVLVGMMGVGKSTVGRRLAARMHLPFVDADREIEAAAGLLIPDIFERFGEDGFATASGA